MIALQNCSTHFREKYSYFDICNFVYESQLVTNVANLCNDEWRFIVPETYRFLFVPFLI